MTVNRPNSLVSTMATLHPIEAFTVPSDAVIQSGCRLEGSFYGSDGYRAARALFRSGFDLQDVGDHADVFNPPIFKRAYVDDEIHGVPYLTGSALIEARPSKDAFLSKKLSECLDELAIRQGMVLISDSGSIGRTVLATTDIDGWVSTNNLIRVLSTNREIYSQEYFYTFFVTSVGEYLLTRNTYGSVVEHIEPSHVRKTPFPVLPLRLRERLTETVEQVSRLRVEANGLLDQADVDVRLQCGLPPLDELHSPNSMSFEHYLVPAHVLLNSQYEGEHHRLDAPYYAPLPNQLRRRITESGRFMTVADATSRVVLIPKTFVEGVYKVEKDYGIPYFTGKELFRTRISPEVYITSSNDRLISRLVVEHETTLVTCAGTVGRVMYVKSNLEGYTVTHDAIRIYPNGLLAPGFLYAFLASAYGQVQIQRCSYGSVIPRLYRTHIENILVPKPDDNGDSIASLVDAAFTKRQEADLREAEAISLFETAIEEGRETTEDKWGREY